MRVLNLRTAALALVAGLGLGGCAYGPYGGLGVGVGYGNGYYDPYYDGYGYGRYGYGARYGYGYGSPYYGWYDGFYYPGSGYWVYDRYRNRHRMSDAQRRYWEWRQKGAPASRSPIGRVIENWADFQNGPQASTNVVRQQSIASGSTIRTRPVRDRQVSIERQQVQQQVRAERRETRRAERSEARTERIREIRERRRGRKAD